MAHRTVGSATRHSWRLIHRGIAQGSIPYPILFKIFSTELNTEAECTLSESADDVKLEGVADLPVICDAVQRDERGRRTGLRINDRSFPSIQHW